MRCGARKAMGKAKGNDRPIILEGVVREALRNYFRVEIFPDGREPGHPLHPATYVLAYPCGQIRYHKIRIVPGDRVTVAVSRHDYSRGRIMFRAKE